MVFRRPFPAEGPPPCADEMRRQASGGFQPTGRWDRSFSADPQVLLELVECRIFNRQELESVQITQALHVIVELVLRCWNNWLIASRYRKFLRMSFSRPKK